MTNPHNKQSKELRIFVLKRFVLSFIVYVLVALAFYAAFDTYISPAIGNVIADNTSTWEYISSDHVDQIWSGHKMIQVDRVPADNQEPTIIRYRTLDTYASLKTIKDDALPLLFIFGIAGLIFYSLNKFVGYFDELSTSVAALMKDKTTPIQLSKELATTQTELTYIQQEALRSERLARESEERKKEMVAYLAHDLRTPLTSILGYASLLKGQDLPKAKQRKYVAVVDSQAKKMNTMLNDLFEIIRLDMQEFKLNKQEIDLQILCLQITDDFYPTVLDKNLSFQVAVPLYLKYQGDPIYLTRALGNIIRNAIAYAAPKTEISLQAATNKSEITLKITNKGKEISPQALPHIFDAFYREDPARNTNKGGAGLGLAISKSIIKAHGGTISASSQDGATEFIITLPC